MQQHHRHFSAAKNAVPFRGQRIVLIGCLIGQRQVACVEEEECPVIGILLLAAAEDDSRQRIVLLVRADVAGGALFAHQDPGSFLQVAAITLPVCRHDAGGVAVNGDAVSVGNGF